MDKYIFRGYNVTSWNWFMWRRMGPVYGVFHTQRWHVAWCLVWASWNLKGGGKGFLIFWVTSFSWLFPKVATFSYILSSQHTFFSRSSNSSVFSCGRLGLKCDGTRSETKFRLSAKRTSPFISAGASVHSTTASRGVRTSGSNAGYTMFRGSVKSTGYPLHSPVSPSLPLPCVTVCHHISTGLCNRWCWLSIAMKCVSA